MKPEVHDNLTDVHYQANSVANFAENHHKVILVFSLALLKMWFAFLWKEDLVLFLMLHTNGFAL